MIQKGRTRVDWNGLIDSLENDARFKMSSLTLETVRRIPGNLEMHDGIIVATALLIQDSSDEDAAVITRDRQIRESGLVQTVW